MVVSAAGAGFAAVPGAGALKMLCCSDVTSTLAAPVLGSSKLGSSLAMKSDLLLAYWILCVGTTSVRGYPGEVCDSSMSERTSGRPRNSNPSSDLMACVAV